MSRVIEQKNPATFEQYFRLVNYLESIKKPPDAASIFRNRLVHGYFEVDIATLTVTLLTNPPAIPLASAVDGYGDPEAARAKRAEKLFQAHATDPTFQLAPALDHAYLDDILKLLTVCQSPHMMKQALCCCIGLVGEALTQLSLGAEKFEVILLERIEDSAEKAILLKLYKQIREDRNTLFHGAALDITIDQEKKIGLAILQEAVEKKLGLPVSKNPVLDSFRAKAAKTAESAKAEKSPSIPTAVVAKHSSKKQRKEEEAAELAAIMKQVEDEHGTPSQPGVAWVAGASRARKQEDDGKKSELESAKRLKEDEAGQFYKGPGNK